MITGCWSVSTHVTSVGWVLSCSQQHGWIKTIISWSEQLQCWQSGVWWHSGPSLVTISYQHQTPALQSTAHPGSLHCPHTSGEFAILAGWGQYEQGQVCDPCRGVCPALELQHRSPLSPVSAQLHSLNRRKFCRTVSSGPRTYSWAESGELGWEGVRGGGHRSLTHITHWSTYATNGRKFPQNWKLKIEEWRTDWPRSAMLFSPVIYTWTMREILELIAIRFRSCDSDHAKLEWGLMNETESREYGVSDDVADQKHLEMLLL